MTPFLGNGVLNSGLSIPTLTGRGPFSEEISILSPKPGEAPRLRWGEGGYEKRPHTKEEEASLPWVAVCATVGLTGLFLGFVVRAETSDTSLNYPVAGGVVGLSLCALGYVKWG